MSEVSGLSRTTAAYDGALGSTLRAEGEAVLPLPSRPAMTPPWCEEGRDAVETEEGSGKVVKSP